MGQKADIYGLWLTADQFKRLDIALIIGFPQTGCVYRVVPGSNGAFALMCKVPMSKNDWMRVILRGLKDVPNEQEEDAALAAEARP